MAITEYRGDWKWHAQLWSLKCWWRASSICHWCTAELKGERSQLDMQDLKEQLEDFDDVWIYDIFNCV